MKLTFNWLKEFVDLRESPQKIASTLTMSGFEIESLEPCGPVATPEDWLLDVAVLPHRGDCLGILGVARELAALTGRKLKLPPARAATRQRGAKLPVAVEVKSPKLCPRYSARMAEGVGIAPAPAWMRSRLEACGIRAINNVVDVTNYVMLETGQPLHAFDVDRLGAKRIVVRQAGDSRRLVTLDGVERQLHPEDLLICDGEEPAALAGIMGGMSSEVHAGTRSVLLESAHFEPLSVRHTAKRLGVHTEASHRFERGVDPEGTLYALDRAVFLLAEVAGAVPLEAVADQRSRSKKAAPVVVRDERVASLLGVRLRRSEIEGPLRALGLKIQQRSKKSLKVLPPSFRFDLGREADLIEEVARFHGYDKIGATLPRVRPQAKADPYLRWRRRVGSFLVGEGLVEVINLAFASAEMNSRFPGIAQGEASPVRVLNPLTQEHSEMRLSLIPGLIGNLRAHAEQKVRGFAAFEIGKVFRLGPSGLPEERSHLGVLLYGRQEHRGLGAEEPSWTFFDLKGLAEGVLELLGLSSAELFAPAALPEFLHPGKAATLGRDGERWGVLGEVHPDLRGAFGLPACAVCELDFELLLEYARWDFTVLPLPRFPSVARDISVVVDEAFPAERIIRWIKELGHSMIKEVRVFDEYRGAPVPEGKKSLAYAISYRDDHRTLTDDEVNAAHQDLVGELRKVFGAELRA